MKLEIGKSYKTRSGLKVEVASINNLSEKPIAAWLYTGQSTDLIAYTQAGYVADQLLSDCDIMEEWEDEPLLVIAPGVFRMRNGEKAEVLHVLSIDLEYPLRGYTERDETLKSWTKEGLYGDFESYLDLVERI